MMKLIDKFILVKRTLKRAYFSWHFEYRENQLFQCVVNQDMIEAKWLIENGADINYQDKQGDSALHYAINAYRIDLIKPLIELGANINITNNEGITPLMCMCKIDYQTSRYNPNPLLDSANQHIVSSLEFMLESGAHINTVDNHSYSALLYSLLHNNTRIVKRLIDLKANLYIKDKRGQDFLDELCSKKDYELLTYVCTTYDKAVIDDIIDRLDIFHNLNKLNKYEQYKYDKFKKFLENFQRKNRFEDLFPEKNQKPQKKVKI